MTESRIDTVAKSLARGLPRRRLLGGLGGGAITAAALLGLPRSALVCQEVGRPCDAASGCCDGATCEDGACRCAAGRNGCGGGRCVDHDRDAKHCGRCGKSCIGATARRTCCGGACVDADGDRANCGACGAACGDHELCVLGHCLGCPIDTVPCRNACCAAERCVDGRCLAAEAAGGDGGPVVGANRTA